jgi:hypothetical protein
MLAKCRLDLEFMTYKGHDDHEAQHTLHCFFIERLIGGERQT